MKEKLLHIISRIKESMLKDMWRQTKWIYAYARHYWLAMFFYTALGLVGTVLGFGSSVVSKDMVDIITGHETGELVQTFCMMIGLAIANVFIGQVTGYATLYFCFTAKSLSAPLLLQDKGISVSL